MTKTLELRGTLTAVEFATLPFAPKRMFWIQDVPPGAVRGNHAHRTCSQQLFVMSGSVTVNTLPMTAGGRFYLPPLTWTTLEHFSADAIVLVLCSEPYDAADYIHDKDEFLKCLAA